MKQVFGADFILFSFTLDFNILNSKVVDPICISLNITKLYKDEKYTIMMMYMKSYSYRL